jgi:hypothetical protein
MVPWHANFIATCTDYHSSKCLISVSKANIKYVRKLMRGPIKFTKHVCKPTPADPSINDVACHKKLISHTDFSYCRLCPQETKLDETSATFASKWCWKTTSWQQMFLVTMPHCTSAAISIWYGHGVEKLIQQ